MTIKINGLAVKEALMEHFKEDADILKDVSALLAFCTAASSGDPLSLMAGLALITKTAGASISAGCNIAKRIIRSKKESHKSFSNYDQFRSLFYISCMKCYLEALKEGVAKIKKQESQKSSVKQMDCQAS